MLSISLPIIVISIGLVVAAGALIRRRGNPNTMRRRIFLFYVWTGIGLLALTVLINLPISLPGLGYGITYFLAPLMIGVSAMALLQLGEWRSLRGREKSTILSAIFVLVVALFWMSRAREDWQRTESFFLYLAILTISVCLFVIWRLGNRFPILVGMIALSYMVIFNGLEMGSMSLPPESLPGWLAMLSVGAYLAIPVLVIGAAAMLLSNAIDLLPAAGGSGVRVWGKIALRLALLLILLIFLLYTFAWMWIWDGTDDGVRGYIMVTASTIVATAIAAVFGLSYPGWRGCSGFAFAVLVIAMIWYRLGFDLASGLTNYTVTEQRAVRIQEAIEEHKAATGSYPAELGELVPGELWRIPLPMILPDQDWCYESGADHYRLGLVYRDHWSSPYLSLRVYASNGNIPETSWICEEKLAELRSQYEAAFNTPPTPAPLPTSVTSVERTIVEPLLRANSFSVGSWSPDGAYFVFGLTEYFWDEEEHVTIDLRFLEAKTGAICQPGESKWTVQKSDGLREHHAWLPDGRLLYVTDAGEMLAFQPCEGGAEKLADRYRVTFTHVVSFDAGSGRALLKEPDGYWLLNGTSLEIQPVVAIPVNPTEISWAWYAWSPGGERLAMSMLVGPEGKDGAFLYMTDGESGEVIQSLSLPGASDVNLPVVEWLTRDEVLIHGKTLTAMDLRSDPPAMTDLIRDVFLLDMEYPLDVSAMDSLPGAGGRGYFIALRMSHPNNQGLYLFDSETGRVTVFQHETPTLLFSEDGRCLRLPKWEDEPAGRDEYEMVWLDQPAEERRLVVEGHVPRSYPQIFPRCLPQSSRLIFSSSQGVSLVSVPEGKTLRFWELAGGGIASQVYPSPAEDVLVVAPSGDGLYYIPLPPE